VSRERLAGNCCVKCGRKSLVLNGSSYKCFSKEGRQQYRIKRPAPMGASYHEYGIIMHIRCLAANKIFQLYLRDRDVQKEPWAVVPSWSIGGTHFTDGKEQAEHDPPERNVSTSLATLS